MAELQPAVVRAVRDVASDVRLLELEPATPAAGFPLGSHLDIAVLIRALPDVRSYSLVGDAPVDGAYRIAVKEVAASRGGSRYVRGLRPGARVSISHPKSHFELRFGAAAYLLIAGGIGITPLVGMATALARHGRPLRMVYAARTREHLAFARELGELLGDRLELVVSAEGARIDVDEELAALPAGGDLYLCGPPRLRQAVQRAWRDAGRPPECLRLETFGSGGRFAPEPFAVCVHDRGGRRITVPADRTMLEALRDEGVEIVSDCLRGECGLCQVKVLASAGELDHRDVFLSEDERRAGTTMLACVSRAVGGAVTIDAGYRPPTTQERTSG